MEFHFEQPPKNKPWSKAIAQLNREFELNHAKDLRQMSREKKQTNKMKKIKSFLLIACMVTIVGCANFATNLYNTENTTVDIARAAVSTYNQYYKNSTNGLSSSALQDMNAQRDQIYDASRKLGASLKVLDQFRLAYTANKNTTNETQATIALQVVSEQSSNIVSLVKIFTK